MKFFGDYSPALYVLGAFFVISCLVVPHHYFTESGHANALIIAFLCGSIVGTTEIASRYRDEQVKAILSPDGLVYVLLNGGMSYVALFFIFYCVSHKFEAFAYFKDNLLGSAVAAGFGAATIMRTKLAVIKGTDNKDVAIGPDIVIGLLLALIDRRIDRRRASRRQTIVAEHFSELKELGTAEQASKYLLVSLVSFQNLSENEIKQFSATIAENSRLGYADNLQLAAIGFLLLTVAGEENFEAILKNAKVLQARNPQGLLDEKGVGPAKVSIFTADGKIVVPPQIPGPRIT